MKKLFKLVPIALFGICLVFNSCSEEVNDFKTNSEFKKLAIEFSDFGQNTPYSKSLTTSNYEDFMASLNEGYFLDLDTSSSEIWTLEHLATTFEINFGIPHSDTLMLFDILERNQELILSDPSGELLTAALLEELNEKDNQHKWLFNAIFEISGSESCVAGVMAAFADTAINGVAVVAAVAAAAPTGGLSVGAAWGAGLSFAANYATLVYRVANCK